MPKLPSLFPDRSKRGAALLEYGLLLGLIAVVAVGSVSGLGRQAQSAFAEAGQTLSGTMTAAVEDRKDGGQGIEPWQPHPNATYAFRITAGDLGSYGTGYARWMGDGEIDDLSQSKDITALYTNEAGNSTFLFTQEERNLVDNTSVIRCDGGPFHTLGYLTTPRGGNGTQWHVRPGQFQMSIGDRLECEVFKNGIPDDLK